MLTKLLCDSRPRDISIFAFCSFCRWHNPNVFNVIKRLVISWQGQGKEYCILKHSEEAMKVGKHNRTFANDIFLLRFYFMVEIFSSFMIYKNLYLHILTLSEAVTRQHRNHGGKKTKANHTIWIIASVHKCVSSSTALWRMVRSMCIITSQFRILTTLLNAGQKSGGGGGGNARK